VHRAGNEFRRWDLRIRGGRFGEAALLMVIEEHGQGRQLVRFRLWPCAERVSIASLALAAVASVFEPLFLVAAALLLWWIYRDLATAVAHARLAVRSCDDTEACG
jgi:hypothetical protein